MLVVPSTAPPALAIRGAVTCQLTPPAAAATSAPDPAGGGPPAPGTVVTLTEQATGVDLVCAGAHHTVDLAGNAKILIGSTHVTKGHPVVEVKTETEDL